MDILKYENVEWNLPFLFGVSGSRKLHFIDSLILRTVMLGMKSPIKYLHGSVINRWNGEETFDVDYKDISMFDKTEKFNIIPLCMFSAYHIEDNDLSDKRSNELLSKVYNADGQVEISSDKLYDYIKSKYPSIKTVASYLKSVYELEEGKEVDFYKKLLDKYDRVVLSPQYVKTRFLNDADKYDDTSRFEVIVNDRCIMNCPKIKEHSIAIEKNEKFIECPMKTMNLKEVYENSLSLGDEEIENLIKVGVRTFRIKGQVNNIEDDRNTILSYIFKRFGISSFFLYSIGG